MNCHYLMEFGNARNERKMQRRGKKLQGAGGNPARFAHHIKKFTSPLQNPYLRPCTAVYFTDRNLTVRECRYCGSGKMSSPDILMIISDNHLCPSCTQVHDLNYKCNLTFQNGTSRVCPKGCMQNGFPVHKRACMHSNQAPFVTVSKVSADKSVPLVETLLLGIQYDTGC